LASRREKEGAHQKEIVEQRVGSERHVGGAGALGGKDRNTGDQGRRAIMIAIDGKLRISLARSSNAARGPQAVRG